MKALFTVLFFTILSFSAKKQEQYSVEACFDSYYQGSYCFVDMEGTTYTFQGMEPSAKQKYDLSDGSNQGRMFIVVYTVEIRSYEEEDEDDDGEEDEYRDNIIVDLELVG